MKVIFYHKHQKHKHKTTFKTFSGAMRYALKLKHRCENYNISWMLIWIEE